MKMQEIDKLINKNQLDKAQLELSKLGETFFKDAEYLYLRIASFFFIIFSYNKSSLSNSLKFISGKYRSRGLSC